MINKGWIVTRNNDIIYIDENNDKSCGLIIDKHGRISLGHTKAPLKHRGT